MSEGKPSLVAKLANAMTAISRVPKRGHNAFQNYDYPMEVDIVEAVREKLAEQKVFLFSTVDEVSCEELKSDKGSVWRTTVTLTFTFVDGESGETFSVNYIGVGDDKGDKGIYKAYTGALKYCLLKNFLIPTGDDPEADEETDKRNYLGKAAPSQPQQPPAPQPPVSPPPAQQVAPQQQPPAQVPQPTSNGQASMPAPSRSARQAPPTPRKVSQTHLQQMRDLANKNNIDLKALIKKKFNKNNEEDLLPSEGSWVISYLLNMRKQA